VELNSEECIEKESLKTTDRDAKNGHKEDEKILFHNEYVTLFRECLIFWLN
jgi:hypothetical protein